MSANKEMQEIRKLSDQELQELLTATREAIYRQRFKSVVDEMKDTSVMRKTKKKLARILHEMGERNRKQAQSEESSQ